MPKRRRSFLKRDAELQSAALRLFLRAVESCLRVHGPGSGPAVRLGALAFIHRFGATLNVHLHFHCVVIDGVFEPAPTDGMVFHAARALDATAITQVQALVHRRMLHVFVRRSLLPGDAAQAMARWEHGGGFSVDASVRVAATDHAGRELDPEHLRYERAKPGPGGTGPLFLTPLQLLDRIYEAFPLVCTRCGADMRIIAFITDASAIRDLLVHLGEPTAPPRIAPARGPPQWDLPAAGADGGDHHAQPAPEYEFDQRLAW